MFDIVKVRLPAVSKKWKLKKLRKITGYIIQIKIAMPLLKFTQFINEAEITDEKIVSELKEIKTLKDRLKEISKETKGIESKLKEFDQEIKPIFDSMKELEDKLAITEKFILKITKYGHTRTDVTWKAVVDQALNLVDDTAKAIISDCMELNKKLVEVKHSYEIEELDEANIFDKFKSILSRSVDKFKGMFGRKIARIDSVNQKLEKLAAKLA